MTSQNEWNRFVTDHAPRSGAFLQSWGWGEFQRAVGREVRRYSDERGAAQVVSYPIHGNFYGWDLHRGPVGDASEVLRQAQDDLKKTSGLFLHIEPNDETYNPQQVTLSSAKNRQPQTTLIVDLSKSEDELLAAMHEKTRYNIRLAARHGVVVAAHTPETLGRDFDDFTRLLRQTADRDRFHLHSATYYRKMIETIPNAVIFTASHEGETLAAALVIFFGDTATYLHGASSNEKRNLMAPHALHGEIMRKAKQDGFRYYDFWGIASPNATGAIVQGMAPSSHPWAGITRFKTGFGGEVISMPEAAELPLRPFWYRMYRLAQRIKNPHP